MGIAAVFGADTHLSEAVWTSRAQIRGDSFFGFTQLVDLAVEHKCPLVIAGDCWELMHQARPSSVTVEFVRGQLDRLELDSLPFYYVNGQHDQLAAPFWFKAIHSWPTHVGQSRFELAGQRWFGVDYFEDADAAAQLALIPPDVDGVVLHKPWEEFVDSKFLAPTSLATVPYGRVLVSGDMHRTIIDDTGSRLYISPGATHMRTIAEPVVHHAVLMDRQGKFVTHQLRSRPVLSHSVLSATALYQEMEGLRARVEAATRTAAQAAIPIEVARPVLIVEDHVGCDAVAVIEQTITGAHVLARRVSRTNAIDDAQAVEILNDQVDVRELFYKLAVERAPDDMVRAVALRALISDQDVVAATLGKLQAS